MKIKGIVERILRKVKKRPKLHFLHIGKTGGTAIKYALKGQVKTSSFELILHGHKTKLSDIPSGEQFFFCVRDPIKRFVSGFYSRQRQGRPNYKAPWRKEEKIAFEIFNTPNELGLALSSNDEKLKSSALFAMKSIAHVKTSYWDWFINEAYLSERASDVVFVCHQHQLKSDFNKLKDVLGVPKHLELPDKNSVPAHANPEILDKNLDDQAIKNLKEWYSKDYSFLELIKEIFN